MIDDIAKETRGYCGADVKALCTEAALTAVRRSYPEIYESRDKLVIDLANVKVSRDDFMASMKAIVPASMRSGTVSSYPLSEHLVPVLGETHNSICEFIDILVPLLNIRKESQSALGDNASLSSKYVS